MRVQRGVGQVESGMSERAVAKGDFVLVNYTISMMEETGERVIALHRSRGGGWQP